MKLWNHILRERTEEGRLYSQGRFYLFVSIIAYYITLGIMTFKAVRPSTDIDLGPEKLIIEALQWAIALFAGYTFGGKGLDVLKLIFNKNDKGTPPPPGPAPAPAAPAPASPAPPANEIPADRQFPDPVI